jgi:hypothetical protein
MAEVLVRFSTIVAGPNGSRWIPRACGRAQDGGLWEGWIEFEPVNAADEVRRTSRESVQPNRDDLMYWAQGLTQTYLEGALQRALNPTRVLERRVTAHPRFDAPANRAPQEAAPVAVLNPFEVYRQGEDVLVRQLSAMSATRLRDIAVAYGFASRQAADAETAETIALTILDGVRKPPTAPHR